MLIAGGSVTGSRHQNRLNVRNNQDAYSWHEEQGSISSVCAVICDGCGSSPHSDMGAKMFSKYFAYQFWMSDYRLDKTGQQELDNIAETAQYYLGDLADSWCDDVEIKAQIIKDYFLFTTVVCVASWYNVYIISLGDGVAYLNGERIDIPKYPNNAPPYLAYGTHKFKIHAQIPIEDFETCLIGSDGVDDLEDVSEFWDDDKYFQNKDQVRRRLAVINKRTIVNGREVLGPLVDDTTLVVIRKGDKQCIN